MSPNIVQDLFAQLQNMTQSHQNIFLSAGLDMYRAVAVILFSWFGITSALSGDWRMDRLAKLAMTVAFGLAMIKFYAVPIPGLGYSFSDLILEGPRHFANALNQDIASTLLGELNKLWEANKQFSITDIFALGAIVSWLILIGLLIACYLATIIVIAFGYVAMAVMTLVGPIFIPFFIVPQMEWMFWGWLKSFIQYAFYPVVANAFLYCFGQMLFNFITRRQVELTSGNVMALLIPLVVMGGVFVFGMVKIPSVVNSLFTGKSGESVVPSFARY